MDLLELTDAIKKLFNVDGVQRLGDALKDCVLNDDVPKFDAFVQLVDGDLSQDWLQKVYQYYLADRKDKKQDYTPKCLAGFLSRLIGDADCVVDLCAGSGALTIQRWTQNPNQRFELYEIDDRVVPFLLFNLAVRNIVATVYVGDALAEDYRTYRVMKGTKYASVTSVDEKPQAPALNASVSLVSNPPYNMPWTAPALAGLMQKFVAGIPPKNNANYAFITTAVTKIRRRAALLLPTSVLNPSSKEEKGILATMIAENVVAAAILLPDNMFESTSIGTCVLLLEKARQTRKIALIDLRNRAEQEIREQRGQFGGASHTGRVYKKTVNVLTFDVMRQTVEAIDQMTSAPDCVVVEPEQVAEKDFALNPSRYMEPNLEAIKRRPFEDIAADYNHIVALKNAIHITCNKTAAKTLGLSCLDVESPDITKSFAVVGQKPEKENFITFSASDGIVIRCSTKNATIHPLVLDFLRDWTMLIRMLNVEENLVLAEFRDALCEKLMSGEIKV